MGIKERLREVRTFLKVSQEALAIETGLQRTTLAGYESGISLPRAEFLRELSIKYNINPNWILTGQGEMLVGQDTQQKHPLIADIEALTAPRFESIESRLSALERLVGREDSTSGEYPEETVYGDYANDSYQNLFVAEPEGVYYGEERVKIPYVRDIAAGPPIRQAEDSGQRLAVPARLIKKGERYYAASVRGGSMAEAGIRDGDTVLIRRGDTPRDGAIQVVRYKDRSTLKRLREVEGKGWELHYEDGTGTVIPVDSGQYEIQGDFTAVLPENSVPD